MKGLWEWLTLQSTKTSGAIHERKGEQELHPSPRLDAHRLPIGTRVMHNAKHSDTSSKAGMACLVTILDSVIRLPICLQ